MLGVEKIKDIQELAEIVSGLKAENKKIVHCHGCFDLLHIGHIRYFEQARALGDVLVVTVTPDRYVGKGSNRPAFTEELRVEAVASLSCVDFVALNQWPTAEETLETLRPDIYVKGSEFRETSADMTTKIGRETAAVSNIGAKMAFTNDIVFSSTNLINRYLQNFPEEIKDYLALFRQRYEIDEIFQLLGRMASLKVLVVGDTILDEYHYCEAIGKSSKEPILALKYLSKDIFAGGVLSIANNLSGFAGEVHLATVLGGKDSYEDLIRKKLDENIKLNFFVQPGAPTIIKRRYVDGYSLNKLIEIYVMDDSGLSTDTERECCNWLAQNIANYDLVLVADYGHGAISRAMLEILVGQAPFLAVNTQANAGNRGFHTITRYARADFVCLDDPEIRLEMRDLTGDIRPMMDAVGRKLGCSHIVVTRGKKGCVVRNEQGDFVAVPAFAHKVVDRVGAGDAFLALTSLAAFLNVPDELLGFIGNSMGALAVEIIGNQKSIDKLSLEKYIFSLLK